MCGLFVVVWQAWSLQIYILHNIADSVVKLFSRCFQRSRQPLAALHVNHRRRQLTLMCHYEPSRMLRSSRRYNAQTAPFLEANDNVCFCFYCFIVGARVANCCFLMFPSDFSGASTIFYQNSCFFKFCASIIRSFKIRTQN